MSRYHQMWASPHRGARQTGTVASLNADQKGAVLVMCLGGILAVLLMAMMVYDAGMVTKDKTRAQGAADFSALSQASINARSMNMLAYANIAKRSVWAAHSLYPAHVEAYRDWNLQALVDEGCQFDGDGWSYDDETAGEGGHEDERDPDLISQHDKCQLLATTFNNYQIETQESDPGDYQRQGDFFTFSGADYSDPHWNNIGADIDPVADGLSATYHAEDLRAIDNYQRFVVGSTPWWGWTDQIMTGIRNGATLTGSYPPPPQGTMTGLNDFTTLEGFTGANINPLTAGNPGGVQPGQFNLPVQPGVGGAMSDHITSRLVAAGIDNLAIWQDTNNLLGGGVDDMFVLEHLANNALLVTRSMGIYECQGIDELNVNDDHCRGFAGGMASAAWAQAPGESFLETGLDYSEQAFSMNNDGGLAEPWTLDNLTPYEWLSASSNLVVTYLHDQGDWRGDRGRIKFDFVGGDPDDTGQFFEQDGDAMVALRQRDMYSALGYWGMARGEVTFTGGQPDLWHPAWTGKLRPVSLPGEFSNQPGYDMGDMYHAMLPYFRLAEQMGLSDMDPIDSQRHALDFARMDWMMRSMSDETVEGVPK